MSGHSKWATTKHKKAIKDAKRGNVFSKLSKLITVAVRMGGGDMDANFSLRLAVEKAKKVSMPKDKIENAIKSGTGENKDGAIIEEGLYEGYGPGGVAVIVKVLSDNKNRIVSEIKHTFSKNGGSMGEAGSVKWMFEQKGIVRIESDKLKEKEIDRDEFDLEMMDAGAQELEEQESVIEIQTKMEDLKKVLDVIKEKEIEVESSSLDWIAKDLVPLPENKIPQLERLFEVFDENDDVQDYYTNAE